MSYFLNFSAPKLEVFIGNGNSHFPFFTWESRGNGNGQRVIWVREWEWELLRGNGREWEWANVVKFPYRTAQTQRSSCDKQKWKLAPFNLAHPVYMTAWQALCCEIDCDLEIEANMITFELRIKRCGNFSGESGNLIWKWEGNGNENQ